MLPTDLPSSTPVPGIYLTPDDIPHTIALQDYELGGVAISDTSQGNMARVWKGWVDTDTNNVYVAPNDNLSLAFLVFNEAGIQDFSFAFDQAMRPAVAYQKGTACFLRWFSPTDNAYVTQQFPSCFSPRLTLDDKREKFRTTSDVLFFYLKGNGVICFRRQRDRFLTEYQYATVPGAQSIYRLGMTNRLRIQIEITTTT